MMQQAEIALGIGARSEKGRREDNQDKMTAFSTPLGTFYIVADGMGGHRGGAEASHSVLEGYRKHLQVFPEAADFADVLQHATALTNAEILAAGRSGDPAIAGMGSTVVMAMLRSSPGGMEVLTAHIGDSRAYLLRGGKLTQLTRDHSAVQRMVDEQLITAEAARTHPDLNVLTRAIGKQAEIEIEVGKRLSLYPGDTILLCTDGLWGHVSDEQIAYELSVDRSASETADTLIQVALEQGSDDNITLQILRLEDRSAPGRPYVPLADSIAAAPVVGNEVYRDNGTAAGTAVAASGTYAAVVQTAPASAPVRVEAGRQQKKRAWLYPLLILLCLVLAGGAAYFFRGLWPYPKATPPAKNQTTCVQGNGKPPTPCSTNSKPVTPTPEKKNGPVRESGQQGVVISVPTILPPVPIVRPLGNDGAVRRSAEGTPRRSRQPDNLPSKDEGAEAPQSPPAGAPPQ